MRAGLLLIGLMVLTVFACAVSLESKVAKAQVVTDTFTVNPDYKPMSFSIDKAIWLKRNWGYVFAFFFILLFGSILYYGYKRG
jgi:hypothetical protein